MKKISNSEQDRQTEAGHTARYAGTGMTDTAAS